MSLNSPYKLTPKAKLLDGATAVGDAPAPAATEKGFHTRNHENLHLLVEDTAAGTSIDLKMWVQFPGTTVWAVYDAFGTSGVLQFTSGDPTYVVVPIEGVEKVYFEIDAIVGGTWDAYLGANSRQNE
jgi:hypothetical protein